jgi:hypothetical protein
MDEIPDEDYDDYSVGDEKEIQLEFDDDFSQAKPKAFIKPPKAFVKRKMEIEKEQKELAAKNAKICRICLDVQ